MINVGFCLLPSCQTSFTFSFLSVCNVRNKSLSWHKCRQLSHLYWQLLHTIALIDCEVAACAKSLLTRNPLLCNTVRDEEFNETSRYITLGNESTCFPCSNVCFFIRTKQLPICIHIIFSFMSLTYLHTFVCEWNNQTCLRFPQIIWISELVSFQRKGHVMFKYGW